MNRSAPRADLRPTSCESGCVTESHPSDAGSSTSKRDGTRGAARADAVSRLTMTRAARQWRQTPENQTQSSRSTRVNRRRRACDCSNT